MSRQKIALKNHLSGDQIKARYLGCKDPREARRWHALWLIHLGYSADQAGELIGLQSSWIRRIVHRYNNEGPERLVDGHRVNPGGAKSRLSEEQQQELTAILKGLPPDGGLWTGQKVAVWIEERTGKKTYSQLGWKYLKELGESVQAQRRTYRKAEQTPHFRSSENLNSEL
ncbi:MAG TPA: helix-turn-helix domain-containing protein [Blastocatellia bacterium]|nr:helix-turn-helix domain-containing protein [Blastocatellia bacterium]